MAEKHKIILHDAVTPTSTARTELKTKIAEQFGISTLAVDTLFKKLPATLLRGLSEEEAKKMCALLSELGAVVSFEMELDGRNSDIYKINQDGKLSTPALESSKQEIVEEEEVYVDEIEETEEEHSTVYEIPDTDDLSIETLQQLGFTELEETNSEEIETPQPKESDFGDLSLHFGEAEPEDERNAPNNEKDTAINETTNGDTDFGLSFDEIAAESSPIEPEDTKPAALSSSVTAGIDLAFDSEDSSIEAETEQATPNQDQSEVKTLSHLLTDDTEPAETSFNSSTLTPPSFETDEEDIETASAETTDNDDGDVADEDSQHTPSPRNAFFKAEPAGEDDSSEYADLEENGAEEENYDETIADEETLEDEEVVSTRKFSIATIFAVVSLVLVLAFFNPLLSGKQSSLLRDKTMVEEILKVQKQQLKLHQEESKKLITGLPAPATYWKGFSDKNGCKANVSFTVRGNEISEFTLSASTLAPTKLTPEQVVAGVKSPLWLKELIGEKFSVASTTIRKDRSIHTVEQKFTGKAKVYLQDDFKAERIVADVTAIVTVDLNTDKSNVRWTTSHGNTSASAGNGEHVNFAERSDDNSINLSYQSDLEAIKEVKADKAVESGVIESGKLNTKNENHDTATGQRLKKIHEHSSSKPQ